MTDLRGHLAGTHRMTIVRRDADPRTWTHRTPSRAGVPPAATPCTASPRARLDRSVLRMDVDDVRRLILKLPAVEEYEHGGLPAFRVRGRRLASLLDHDSINLMLPQEAIRAAVAEWPQWCGEEWFGRRLFAVKVRHRSIDPGVFRE